MSEIDRAQRRAMDCLNGWVDAVMPKFNAVEMQALKQRMTATFREYETEVQGLKDRFERIGQSHGFSVHGTDGCRNCEQGRITVYARERWCFECIGKRELRR